ncbi:VOC family protein [Streptomyces sp. NPDC052701]|uniref:VOC family protein n=1 Tax=Streptomyces sp. NPDC052701 TaxID=3155533 RepID=UPI00343E3EE4
MTLDAPDARELAEFYLRLLPGWRVRRGEEEPDWVHIRPPDGPTGLAFQSEPAYVPPVWPGEPGRQQMMIHLDIEVDDAEDLERETARAVAAGARLAAYQPQRDVRVLLDPAGHPFCLYFETRPADQ